MILSRNTLTKHFARIEVGEAEAELLGGLAQGLEQTGAMELSVSGGVRSFLAGECDPVAWTMLADGLCWAPLGDRSRSADASAFRFIRLRLRFLIMMVCDPGRITCWHASPTWYMQRGRWLRHPEPPERMRGRVEGSRAATPLAA